MGPLLSSPKENYVIHLERTMNKLDIIYPLYELALKRVLDLENHDLKATAQKMVVFHDVGKLTRRWQSGVGKGKRLPAHAPIGAAYLWKHLPNGLKEAVSFAVAIHHSDRGLLGDNIEKPDVQAINDGLVNYSDGRIVWDERVSELAPVYSPEDLKNLNVGDLRNMARGLRLWARGCDLLKQHRRRVQAMLLHHILKLCDVSAAAEREEFTKQDEASYFGGWLMVKNIKDYVDSLVERSGEG